MVRADAVPEVAVEAGKTLITGSGYRLTLREGEGGFDIALRGRDGSFRDVGRAGRNLTLGVLTPAGEDRVDGRRAQSAMKRRGDAVVIGQSVPIGLGSSVYEMHLICVDEGILAGVRIVGPPPDGTLLPLPRLRFEAGEFTHYSFWGADGKRHEGQVVALGEPSAYAGVSPWGDRGDTVPTLDPKRPALALGDPGGLGLAVVFLEYDRRWTGSSAFVQRHTPASTLFYPAFIPAQLAGERLWCWLIPVAGGDLDESQVSHVVQLGARLMAEFQPIAPPVPESWLRTVEEFPADLRRTAPVADIREAVVYTVNEDSTSTEALDIARRSGTEVMIRAWFKWADAPDLTQARRYPPMAHDLGALWGGGLTWSALYDNENGITREQLLDMATRGPDGELVDAWGQPGVRHGSLSSPAYLDYLFRWAKEQIDAGADVLFMDEHTAALASNEGFDDHSIADFRAYLLEKQRWPLRDPRWQERFGIPLDDAAVCPGGDMSLFHYRACLKAKGFTKNPWSADNPLARLYAEFREQRDSRAWHGQLARIRAYASSLGRKVLINANGFAPEVDLQVAGVWGDTMTRDGRIDLTEDAIPRWRQRIVSAQRIAGKPVPVVLFHDWGFGDTPFPFLAMPVGDRELWIRIRGAEIYAAGGFLAFPVLGPFGCNAAADGTLGTIQRQAIFYRTHRDVYTKGRYVGCRGLKTQSPNLSVAVWQLQDPKTAAVHVINRAVENGQPRAIEKLRLVLPTRSVPVAAKAYSPDWAGAVEVSVQSTPDGIAYTLPRLEAYAVVIASFRDKADLTSITEPARILLSPRWERPARSEFVVGRGGQVDRADDLPGMLQGKLHTDMRNPPTFLVDAVRAATLTVKVGAVATLGARLEVSVDGKRVAAVDLPDRDGKNDGEAPEYNREITFHIPAGRHRVTLDNSGGDWARLLWLEWTGRFR